MAGCLHTHTDTRVGLTCKEHKVDTECGAECIEVHRMGRSVKYWTLSMRVSEWVSECRCDGRVGVWVSEGERGCD